MKTAKKAIKYAVLALLAAATTAGLLAEPVPWSDSYVSDAIAIKTAALVTAIAVLTLAYVWDDDDSDKRPTA